MADIYVIRPETQPERNIGVINAFLKAKSNEIKSEASIEINEAHQKAALLINQGVIKSQIAVYGRPVYSLAGNGNIVGYEPIYGELKGLPNIESFEDISHIDADSIYNKLIELQKQNKGLYIKQTGTFMWTSYGEVVIITTPKGTTSNLSPEGKAYPISRSQSIPSGLWDATYTEP